MIQNDPDLVSHCKLGRYPLNWLQIGRRFESDIHSSSVILGYCLFNRHNMNDPDLVSHCILGK